MEDTLYIPKKLNVGFQKRSGTYTGKLGYVIYWDDKGKLRKEKSWESWRHKPEDTERDECQYVDGKWTTIKKGDKYGDDVKPLVADNEPMSGFVLNKDAGGVGSGWGWNDRIEKCRVYDPRGFEFEISIPNLLYILQECDTFKGKGIEGEFVYAWSGTELVLLPTHAQEYKNCVEFSDLQAKKISLRDIQVGYDYTAKDGEKYCYVGRHNYFEQGSVTAYKKHHVFYHYESDSFERNTKPSVELGESDTYNEVVNKFKKTKHGREINSIELTTNLELIKKMKEGHCDTPARQVGGKFHLYKNKYNHRSYYYGSNQDRYSPEFIGAYSLKNGLLIKDTKVKETEGQLPTFEQLSSITLILDNGKKLNGDSYY